MANSWLRLWHDMPNDPKWRTISRVSKQPVATVQAVFIHLLVSASRNVTRGHADVTEEDLASSLDVTEEDIRSILDAMQGRVIEEGYITGWDKRQVVKEDSGNNFGSAKTPAERKAAQRERQKQASLNRQKSDESQDVTAESRGVTTDTDTDTDTELKDPPLNPPRGNSDKNAVGGYSREFEEAWLVYPKRAGGNSKQAAAKAWEARIKSGVSPDEIIAGVRRYEAYIRGTGKLHTEFVKQASTFFGPAGHFLEAWNLPSGEHAGASRGRDVNAIPPPDQKIPEGFRG